MFRRLILALALAAGLTASAQAAGRGPIVVGSSGQKEQIQATDTLQLPAPTTANASINLPPGAAPGSPLAGDVWTTSAGLYYRVGGVTFGPLTLTSVTCGTPLTGGTITTTGTCGIATNGLAFSYLAQIGGNSYLGNTGTTTGNVTAYTLPSCIATDHALHYYLTGGTGFQCDAIGSVPTGTNPFYIGSPYYGTGAGAPSDTTAPVGSVWARTDTADLYQQIISGSAVPTLVQDASAAGNSVTMAATPTTGDFMVGFCSDYTGTPSTASGWTLVSVAAAAVFDPSRLVVYKLASTGESTTQTPCSGSNSTIVFEVSGISSWAASYEGQTSAVNVFGGASLGVSFTTDASNTLVLGAFTARGGSGGSVSGLTGGATAANAGNVGVTGAAQRFATNGSGVSVTGTFSTGSGIYGTLIRLTPGSPSWSRLSRLATIKNGGSALSSEPTSLNCSTGTTCTASTTATGDDITITAAPATNSLALTTLAQQAANTVLGNATGSTGNVTALSMPSCSDTSGNHLNWVSGTGWVCGTSLPASPTFTTTTTTNLTVSGVSGSTQCLHANTSGVVSGTGSDCGAGGGGGTTNNNYYAGAVAPPSIRSSSIQSSSAASYTVSFPSGTTTGDQVVIFWGGGCQLNGTPTGWTLIDAQTGSNQNGSVITKTMTSGDIATGNVALTNACTFDTAISAVTFQGSTGGIASVVSNRAGSGVSSVSLSLSVKLPGCEMLYFGSNRATSTDTISSGASVQTVSAGNASAALYGEAVTAPATASPVTFTYSSAGSGYYNAAVCVYGAPNGTVNPQPGLPVICEVVTSGSAASVTVGGGSGSCPTLASTYRDLLVVVTGRSTVSAVTDTLSAQFNGDTGANYNAQALAISNTTATASQNNGVTSGYFGALAGATATANFAGYSAVTVSNYAGTTFQKAWAGTNAVATTTGASGQTVNTVGGRWNSAAAITSVKVFPASGNFVDGTVITIYGIGGSPTATLPVIPPQGRLSLTSGQAVMAADATAQGTIYWVPLPGAMMPVGNIMYRVSSQLSYVLNTTAHTSTNLYDIGSYNSSGVITLCTAPAWTNSTSRNAAISQDATNGIWVNTASLTCNLSGGTSTTTIAAGQWTYLGTFYATANGQTGMAFGPNGAAGGTNNILGLFNAYNPVLTTSMSKDTTANWSTSSTSWQALDIGATGSGLNNRISVVDGLGQMRVKAELQAFVSGGGAFVGISRDSSTAQPPLATQSNASSNVTLLSPFAPSLGFHYFQALQQSQTGSGQTIYGTDPLRSNNTTAISVEVFDFLFLVPAFTRRRRRKPANDNAETAARAA